MRQLGGKQMMGILALFTMMTLLACGPAAIPGEDGPTGIRNMAQNSIPDPDPTPDTEPTPDATGHGDSGPVDSDPPAEPLSARNDCYVIGYNLYINPLTDVEDNVWCYRHQAEEYYVRWLATLPNAPSLDSVLGALRDVNQAVARAPDVAEGYTEVLVCLAGKGHPNVNVGLLFPWQDFLIPAEYETRMRGYTDAERSLRRELFALADDCAMGDSAYYHAQGEAWRAEVKRLRSSNSSKVKPLVDAFIVDVLELSGSDPNNALVPFFLTMEGGDINALSSSKANIMPTPTTVPTPAPRAQAQQADQPPLDGVEGCKRLSVFSAASQFQEHSSWCTSELLKALETQCSVLASTDEQLSCADTYLADWQNPMMRIAYRCYAITDQDAALTCFQSDKLTKSFQSFNALYAETLPVISADTSVSAAHAKVLHCLSEQSFTSTPARLLFHWQTTVQYLGDPAAFDTWRNSLSESEYSLMNQLSEPTDACAKRHGLYAAQDAAWLAEIKRLIADEPDKAQPFLEWHLLEVFEAPGIAPFLTFSR